MNLLAIAEEGSFTRAAAKLGLSQSALSHAIGRLEGRLGVRLLTRTTRSVAPTEAGERLIATIRPAFDDISDKLDELTLFRDKPAGTIRITTPEHAARNILWPVADRLTAEYPDIRIELSVDSEFTDIVAERFDAGVRLGEQIARDMIAVRIGPRLRMAAIAAPSYFKEHPKPNTPQDLTHHSCINLRLTSGSGVYVWEFGKGGRELKVRVDGQLVFNRIPLILDAVLAGRGIAFVMDDQVAAYLADGSIVRVLEDWCEPFDGYHLYYPSKRHASAAFALLVEALRYRG